MRAYFFMSRVHGMRDALVTARSAHFAWDKLARRHGMSRRYIRRECFERYRPETVR